MCEDDEFARVLKQKVEDINSVSHVFYFGTKRSTKERTLKADAQS
jgi:hypothetical protein